MLIRIIIIKKMPRKRNKKRRVSQYAPVIEMVEDQIEESNEEPDIPA